LKCKNVNFKPETSKFVQILFENYLITGFFNFWSCCFSLLFPQYQIKSPNTMRIEYCQLFDTFVYFFCENLSIPLSIYLFVYPFIRRLYHQLRALRIVLCYYLQTKHIYVLLLCSNYFSSYFVLIFIIELNLIDILSIGAQ